MSSFSPKTSMCLYLCVCPALWAGLRHLVMIPKVLRVCNPPPKPKRARSGRYLPPFPHTSNGRKHSSVVRPLTPSGKLTPVQPTPNESRAPRPASFAGCDSKFPNANTVGHPVPRSRPSRMHVSPPLPLIPHLVTLIPCQTMAYWGLNTAISPFRHYPPSISTIAVPPLRRCPPPLSVGLALIQSFWLVGTGIERAAGDARRCWVR